MALDLRIDEIVGTVNVRGEGTVVRIAETLPGVVVGYDADDQAVSVEVLIQGQFEQFRLFGG